MGEQWGLDQLWRVRPGCRESLKTTYVYRLHGGGQWEPLQVLEQGEHVFPGVNPQ